VVFCDCRPDSYLLDLEDARKRLTDRTAAIVAVHLYGHPCDMDAVRSFAGEHGLRVIEDCAQAHGAELNGRRLGALGDIGCFSFYPGKNLGAYGDGGAHKARNGLLLRRDIHSLFDAGYVTVTPGLHFEVSHRIREEFENGRGYYALHGQLVGTPDDAEQKPDPTQLSWHNENCFRG